MPKEYIKVYFSREQLELLDRACEAEGEDRSSLIRSVTVNYLRGLNLIKERVHHGENIPDRT